MGKRIAILGGTGKEGRGLAYRWAKAGHEVVIGSRQIEKAQLASGEINTLLGKQAINGLDNFQAADWGEIVCITVPYSVHKEMLESIKDIVRGKLFIDVTVPLVPPKVNIVHIPEAGSAAQETREILGEETPVAVAFQNISYERLVHEEKIDCDVLVCGSSKQTRDDVIQLVTDAGMTGWDAGPLDNAVVVESLTSILININKVYGSKEAGIKITGVQRDQ